MRERGRGLRRAFAAVMPLFVAGCAAPVVTEAAALPEVTLTPAVGSRDVPISAELGISVTGGRIADVRLIDEKGASVPGAMRDDGSSWLPSTPLRYARSYIAQVTAVNEYGRAMTRTTTFTTMAPPAQLHYSTMYFKDGETYGVAMPVTLRFDPPVPKDARAAVQRRLLVTTDPPQPGVWHWEADGRQVYYRAREFWKPGTRINVRAALAGVPMGGGRYGAADHVASATIGNKVIIEIDNATKQMSVFIDDKLARQIPVSLGKPSTPTSSGNMVIMEKLERTVFDTRGEPNGGYVIEVENAQRLTWGGEFIHAAPWSVDKQGRENVSHGCTNISPENAEWLMSVTHVGDLVTVKNTEVRLARGNGWTAWDMSWEEYVQGSALPVPDELRLAGA